MIYLVVHISWLTPTSRNEYRVGDISSIPACLPELSPEYQHHGAIVTNSGTILYQHPLYGLVGQFHPHEVLEQVISLVL